MSNFFSRFFRTSGSSMAAPSSLPIGEKETPTTRPTGGIRCANFARYDTWMMMSFTAISDGIISSATSATPMVFKLTIRKCSLYFNKAQKCCFFSKSDFRDYASLKDHFKASHFLCEEQSCINEQFTHAFRTDLDLKAHRADRHSGAMSKNEAKMNRQVGVDYNFSRARQGAYSQHGRRQGRSPSPAPQSSASAFSAGNNSSSNDTNKTMPLPDMAQDFPSLSGRVSNQHHSMAAGGQSSKPANMAHKLAKTTGRNVQSWANSVGTPNLDEQDFPSLGGGASTTMTTVPSNYR